MTRTKKKRGPFCFLGVFCFKDKVMANQWHLQENTGLFVFCVLFCFFSVEVMVMNLQMYNQQRCCDTVLPLSAFTAEYGRRRWQGNKSKVKREVLAWKSGIRALGFSFKTVFRWITTLHQMVTKNQQTNCYGKVADKREIYAASTLRTTTDH